MPLTTAQALAKWEGVVSMLAAEKAHAAAHPDQQVSPAGALGMVQSLGLATQELSTPAHTWKVLLQKQVILKRVGGVRVKLRTSPAPACGAAEKQLSACKDASGQSCFQAHQHSAAKLTWTGGTESLLGSRQGLCTLVCGTPHAMRMATLPTAVKAPADKAWPTAAAAGAAQGAGRLQ